MIIFVFILILISLWIYGRWNFGTLEKMGITVVPYTNLLLGHTREIYEKVGPFQDIEWMRKYGNIFGIYEGRQPQIFICEPELVRLMCISEAEYFNDNVKFDFGDEMLNEFPDISDYPKWKILRSNFTPAFTNAKLKLMNLPMREAAQDYVNSLKNKMKLEGKLEKFAIDQSVFSMLTDLILRSIFSIKVTDGKANEEFAKVIKDMMVPPEESGVPKDLVYYSHTFTFLRKLLPSTFKPGSSQKFIKIFKQILEQRRSSSVKKFGNVFDLIVEWFEKLKTSEFKSAGITEFTLICQALVFFLAAQDQVAMMVSAVIYHLTQDPALEKKLYSEVDKVFKGELEHKDLKEFKLLNSCIQEALRLYPVFHRTGRTCTKDWENKKFNLKVKKGTVVLFPLWAINRNEEFTENAGVFNPERFLPENKNKLNVFATTSFGHGPRSCSGMKFAMEMIPVVLAYMLKEFKFVQREDTRLEFTPGGPLFVPHEPIYVDVMCR